MPNEFDFEGLPKQVGCAFCYLAAHLLSELMQIAMMGLQSEVLSAEDIRTVLTRQDSASRCHEATIRGDLGTGREVQCSILQDYSNSGQAPPERNSYRALRDQYSADGYARF